MEHQTPRPCRDETTLSGRCILETHQRHEGVDSRPLDAFLERTDEFGVNPCMALLDILLSGMMLHGSV